MLEIPSPSTTAVFNAALRTMLGHGTLLQHFKRPQTTGLFFHTPRTRDVFWGRGVCEAWLGSRCNARPLIGHGYCWQ